MQRKSALWHAEVWKEPPAKTREAGRLSPHWLRRVEGEENGEQRFNCLSVLSFRVIFKSRHLFIPSNPGSMWLQNVL